MNRCLRRLPVVAVACALGPWGRAQPGADAWRRFAAQSHAVLAELHRAERPAAGDAPAGVTDLAFADLFGPAGDRGLEYSAKLRALEGRAVRLTGCMVRGTARLPGAFLLAARPATDESSGRCAPDVMPAAIVQVILAPASDRPVPYRPGWLTVTGRVELGPRREADGRNSFVRLMSDPTAAAAFLAP